jgi:hypothetical protein
MNTLLFSFNDRSSSVNCWAKIESTHSLSGLQLNAMSMWVRVRFSTTKAGWLTPTLMLESLSTTNCSLIVSGFERKGFLGSASKGFPKLFDITRL